MKYIVKALLTLFIAVVCCLQANGQTGDVRGFVYDKSNGEPIIFGNVYLEGTTIGGSTDLNGLYSINKIEPGDYTLISTYIGYDTVRLNITIVADQILSENLYISPKTTTLGVVEISAEAIEAKTEVKTSTIKVTPKQIKKIPSIGGEPDLVQYLQVLPGVIFTGDQGGQLYIRGGSPIQTKVLVDGATIYNPFHSIGFFSVFETDLIKNVDVMTGGFDAEYGGRISAVIDIATKDGNKKRHTGKIGINPFLSKIVMEGPLKKLDEENEGATISYILSSKYSYLDRSSKTIYSYIDENGLPYDFFDLYGKISFNTTTGSKFNLFGYRYDDDVVYLNASEFNWDAIGFGANFVVVPPQSKTIISGNFAYSDYGLSLAEGLKEDGTANKPRTSDIGGFNLGVNFSYFLQNSQEIKYGFDIGGYSTELAFTNAFNLNIEQKDNTTEIASYIKYRANISDRLILEPGIRFSFYPSLNTFEPEPRLGLKFNITDKLRFKFATGLYSQNFISTKSDLDVVNLFTGFVSGPEVKLDTPNGDEARNNLQKSAHAVAGFEIDLPKRISLNIETYYKRFTQLINFNRAKQLNSDPDFAMENGNAYGFDFLLKYDRKRLFLWGVYSLGFTDRYNGEQTYNPHYDRRHNFNFTSAYKFGANQDFEASMRWNYGSGFPFTLTEAFYEQLSLGDGISTDILTQNGEIGVIFDNEINGGRLPAYHRLDASLKKQFAIGQYSILEVTASVTNVYDRNNIFYFDRIRYERVDQLPILPSLGATFTF